MKECTKCGETKKESQFYRKKGRIDGLSSWCKDCAREINRKRYHERKKGGKKKKKKKKKIPKGKYIKVEKRGPNNYYFVKPRGCRCDGKSSFCLKCYLKSRDVIKDIKKNNDNFWDERHVRSIELSAWEKKINRGKEVISI